jgi:hypothetical protein
MSDSEKSTTESSERKPYERKKPKPPQLWKKGQSGNPKGRPKGSKNQLTLLREAVLHNAEEMVLENWEELVAMTIEMAKMGDTTALKILWDRIIPSKRAVDDRVVDNKPQIVIQVNKMDELEVSEIFGEKNTRKEKVIEGELDE